MHISPYRWEYAIGISSEIVGTDGFLFKILVVGALFAKNQLIICVKCKAELRIMDRCDLISIFFFAIKLAELCVFGSDQGTGVGDRAICFPAFYDIEI